MNQIRNRAFVRRREMRLMAEEHTRAFNAHQLQLAKQVKADQQAITAQVLQDLAEEARTQLDQFPLH